MWNGKKVSVVLPAYDEEGNIKKCIEDFFLTGVVDEVLVIDNNSKDNTANEAKNTKSRIILEKNQGYGYANIRGLLEAKGDIIVTCEPDGTFVANDIFKLLVYTDDFDVVLGTRTSKACIMPGANMGWFLRYGNIFLAKLVEYLYGGPSLTDVGCTFKLLTKQSIKKIKNKLTVGGFHFSPYLIILIIQNNFKCIEVPVNYRERIGKSKITGSFWKALHLGFVIIWLTFRYRIKTLFKIS